MNDSSVQAARPAILVALTRATRRRLGSVKMSSHGPPDSDAPLTGCIPKMTCPPRNSRPRTSTATGSTCPALGLNVFSAHASAMGPLTVSFLPVTT